MKITEVKIIIKILQIVGEEFSLRPGSIEADQEIRIPVQVFEEWRRQSREGKKASADGSRIQSCREGGVSLIPQKNEEI